MNESAAPEQHRMTVLQHIGSAFTPHLRALLTSVMLPLLISIFGTWATNQIQNRDNRLLRERIAFVDEARTFDAVVASYVQTVLDKQPSADASQRVIMNLIRQNDLLDEVVNQLSPEDKHFVTEYRHLLGEFRDVLPVSGSTLHLKSFWEDASKVLVVRNELIGRLQHTR